MVTDIERFREIDLVRRACDAQEIRYEFDGKFTREGLAWVFEKARLQIEHETNVKIEQARRGS
jgi:hypothetical protein